MDLIFHIIPLFGVIALIYTFWRSSWITKQDAGNEKMKVIAGHIAEGAMAVSYTHLRAHETVLDIVCRLLLAKKKTK